MSLSRVITASTITIKFTRRDNRIRVRPPYSHTGSVCVFKNPPQKPRSKTYGLDSVRTMLSPVWSSFSSLRLQKFGSDVSATGFRHTLNSQIIRKLSPPMERPFPDGRFAALFAWSHGRRFIQAMIGMPRSGRTNVWLTRVPQLEKYAVYRCDTNSVKKACSVAYGRYSIDIVLLVRAPDASYNRVVSFLDQNVSLTGWGEYPTGPEITLAFSDIHRTLNRFNYSYFLDATLWFIYK